MPRTPVAWAVGLCALGVLLISRGTPLWWFGGACLVSAAALLHQGLSSQIDELLRRASRPRRILGRERIPSGVALETLYLGFIVYVGAVMMADLWHGERPVSYDHTVHYYKAWQLHQHLLPEGNLYGWSHRMFAGYPVNYLYPFGTDLWVNLVHAAGFGLLSFSRAYGLAFALMHVFTGVAGYRFGRVLGGPHVGVITGLLLLTDLSEFRHGGWAYTVVYGVWPQALSLVLVLLGLCHLPAIFEQRRLAPIGAFGFWIGLSILTHPMVLVFLGMLAAVCAIAAVFADGVKAATGLARLALAYVVALLVACAWLMPFMATRSQTMPMGVWWDSTYEMGRGLLELTALPGTRGYVLAFALCALLLLLRTRRFTHLFVALTAIAIPVVSSSTFIDEFRLPMLSEAFTKVQFLRMSTMVKPFWFALAAYFAVALLRHAPRLLIARDSDPPARRPLLHTGAFAMVVGLLVLPVLVPAFQIGWTTHVAKSLRTVHDRQLQEERGELEKWLRDNLPDPADVGHYRLGIFTGHNHDLFDLAAELDVPIFKRGFTPCSNFVYKMREPVNPVMQAVNLRYVISKVPLTPDDFERLAQFGRYKVYRYLHFQPQPFEVIGGEADVTLRRFSDEEILLDVGPGGHGKLRLSVSWFSRWKAYRDGQPVKISTTYLNAEPDATGFITVPIAPGKYRFAFEREPVDQLALPVGLFGILLSLGLVLVDRRRPAWVAKLHDLADRLSAPELSRGRTLALGVAVVAVVVGAVAVASWRPPIELDGELKDTVVRRVRYDFLENLGEARAWINYKDRRRQCRRIADRFICRDDAGNLDITKYVASSPATIEEYRMERCIRARPEEGARLRIEYSNVPRGHALVGYYGVEFEGRLLKRSRPVEFAINVDGRTVYREDTEKDDKMHWFRVPVSQVGGESARVRFSVRAPNVRKRWLCFHAQMVDL